MKSPMIARLFVFSGRQFRDRSTLRRHQYSKTNGHYIHSLFCRPTRSEKEFHGNVNSSSRTSGADRSMSSSKGEENGDFKLVYVHPLSQIVLECLQASYSDWLARRHLHHNSLSFHRDGTFEIKFPKTAPKAMKSSDESTEVTAVNESSTISKGDKHSIDTIANQVDNSHRTSTDTISDDADDSRIWTSFDEHEKKHWLAVRRGKLVGRYMLQDNLLSAWQGNRKESLPARIQEAVNEMVEDIEEYETKSSAMYSKNKRKR